VFLEDRYSMLIFVNVSETIVSNCNYKMDWRGFQPTPVLDAIDQACTPPATCKTSVMRLRCDMSNRIKEHVRSAILIDSRPFRRAGLVNVLASWADEEGFRLQQSDGATFANLDGGDVGLVMLSVGGEGLSNPQVAQAVSDARARFGEAPIALLCDSAEGPHIRAACVSGVDAYIPTYLEPGTALKALSFVVAGGKFFPPESLFEPAGACASRSLQDGAVRLTQRQFDIIEALQLGHSNKMIARRLNIAEATVKIHIRQIMRKLGVNNRTQIALAALSRRECVSTAAPELAPRAPSDQLA
jgi:DNA-binding NarL/FixJ family response regulator